MLIGHGHHRLFIAITLVIILVFGIFIGSSLTSKLDTKDFEAVIIGLMFTIIILLLIVGSFVLEIREALRPGVLKRRDNEKKK